MQTFTFSPIGILQCQQKYTYDVPRQGILAEHTGIIELNKGENFEQALQDIEGFERIWLLYVFHENSNWKPLIHPPRGDQKVGVFASRSPHRPNPIGMSCVTLCGVNGRKLYIAQHDLLDGTPILDIKPYIPYADAFPQSAAGWLDHLPPQQPFAIDFSPKVHQILIWFAQHHGPDLGEFIRRELTFNPIADKRKRLSSCGNHRYILAYRTWRIEFSCNLSENHLYINRIFSGYSPEELLPNSPDLYGDKSLHRKFISEFEAGNENIG